MSHSEPERARVSQSDPESELGCLQVSLRVTLGPNLVRKSQPGQYNLENTILSNYSLIKFYDDIVFLRVSVTE